MSAKIAVITGGEGDLAAAIARELGQAGYEVLAPGRADLEVTQPESVGRFFASHQRIDYLINNAGAREDSRLATMTEGEWDRVLQVNLRGAFLCSQAVSLGMIRQRAGHILSIGSFSAKWGNSGQANYAAAKAGLVGMTQSLARELGGRGVRANCVLPGYLETKFTASVRPNVRRSILQAHELGSFNTVDDAARFIAFLDTMLFVSGQVFQLDSRVAPWT